MSWNFSIRAGGEIIKNLTLDAKLNYTYQKGQGRPEFSASGFNPIFALIYTPRSINLHEMKDVFDKDGKIIRKGVYKFGTLDASQK